MGNIFSGSEIIEMGIQIEKNGKNFYDALVEKVKDDKAKEVFKYLAAEEAKHIAAFQNILDSVKKYEPPESYPGEYFAYMNALAGDYVFTRKDAGAEFARNAKNDKEACNFGIKFEKESVIFYEHIKEAVPENEHKIIDELILQELGHLKRLYKLKEEM